jgi:hypothetical protein
MEILRKNKIPAIYITIPWIRNPARNIWADCKEDIELINQMKKVCTGKTCLSSFDGLNNFYIKAEFPENWNDYYGETGECIYWHYYHWNVWDVLYLIENNKPYEAVSLEDAGIPFGYLETLENTNSCIPMLKELRKSIKYAELTKEKIESIEKYEDKVLSQIKLKILKGSANSFFEEKSLKKQIGKDKIVSEKLRKEVLRRDNYRCVFCGSSAEDSKLEVDHIIPKAIIKKMNLDDGLHLALFNLCTACISCNREKSDFLQPEDIEHYIRTFDKSNHPNQRILQYLLKIRELQNINKK